MQPRERERERPNAFFVAGQRREREKEDIDCLPERLNDREWRVTRIVIPGFLSIQWTPTICAFYLSTLLQKKEFNIEISYPDL